MLGAVIGDIAGSYYSENPTLRTDCEIINRDAHFTQNIVLAAALCDLLCYNGKPAKGKIESKLFAREAAVHYKKFASEFITISESSIKTWAAHGSMMRSSIGSSAAMIAALPCAYAYKTYEQAAAQAALACEYIYDTDSCRSAAKALVTAVFILSHGGTEEQAAAICRQASGIDFSGGYSDYTSMKQAVQADTSPEAVMQTAFSCVCGAKNFSESLRRAFACGRVSHVTAAAAGAMMEAKLRRVPNKLKEFAVMKLDVRHKMAIERFCDRFCKQGMV